MGNQQERLDTKDLLPIPEYDGYFIDRSGEVYSTYYGYLRKLKQHIHFGRSKNPYKRMKFGVGFMLVHRIVASVLIGRPLIRGEVVNHLNGKTTDNNITNLEVVTHKENVAHAVRSKLYCQGEAWHKARVTKQC